MADNLLDDTTFLLGSQAADDAASSIGDTTAMIAGLELSEARIEILYREINSAFLS